ncbi:MAG: ATP-binding protein [Bacteroidales bacterium]|nr:ATP-binding protein [Bacteroidales bacterium]
MDGLIDKLSNYNLWNGNKIQCGFIRTHYLECAKRYIGGHVVKVLTGQRRVGKSYIMRQIAQMLVEEGVNCNNILIVNREFAAFDPIKTYSDFVKLIDEYRTRFKPEGRVYLFIDEVQEIEDWERIVNSYSQDYAYPYEVFISGSNSKMFSGELATLLSGRYVEIPIFPLSYDEYSTAHGLQKGRQSYMQYMADSGYPEMLNFEDSDVKRNYISGLRDTVLLKDVISRYTIRDVKLLDDLFVYIVNNASCLLSISNIVNYMKSRGRKVSYDTAASYIDYIESAYLIHRALRYNIRGRGVVSGQYKYYANDLAFKNYLYSGYGYGIGYMLENLVYLQLIASGYSVYVGTIKDKEVDFVAIKNDHRLYVQATYMLVDEATIEREYSPLRLVPDNYEKLVVSLDDIQLPSCDGIEHVQAWHLSNHL